MAERIHFDQCPLCGSSQVQEAVRTRDYSISGEEFQLWDCTDCGFRFTQDIPSPQVIGRYYESEDYISHSDTKEGLINRLYHLAREYMLGRKRKLVKEFAADRHVLDVGCGTGYFLQHLRNYGYEVQGVEVDEGARTFAKTHFDLDVLPPDDLLDGRIEGPFGLISMWHVLEHVHEPRAYLQRLRDILLPEGTLMIAVPNRSSLDARLYGGYWAAYDVPRHLWHFTPQNIARFSTEEGFRLIGKKRLPLDPFYVSMLSERYQERGLAPVRGALAGLRSHLQSLANIDHSSSLVYLLRKQ